MDRFFREARSVVTTLVSKKLRGVGLMLTRLVTSELALVLKGLSALSAMLFTWFIATQLPIEEFGAYSFFSTLILFVSLVSQFGSQEIFYRVANNSGLEGNTFTLTIVRQAASVSFLAILLTSACAIYVSQRYADVVFLVVFCAVINVALLFLLTITRALRFLNYSILAEGFCKNLLALLGFIFATRIADFQGISAIYFGYSMALLLLLIFTVKKLIDSRLLNFTSGKFCLQAYSEQVKSGFFLTLSSVTVNLQMMFPIFYLELTGNLVLLAQHKMLMLMISPLSMMVITLNHKFAPDLSQASSVSIRSLNSMYKKATSYTIRRVAIAYIAVCIAGFLVVVLGLPKDYEPVAAYLPIYGAIYLVVAGMGPALLLVVMMKEDQFFVVGALFVAAFYFLYLQLTEITSLIDVLTLITGSTLITHGGAYFYSRRELLRRLSFDHAE